MTRLVFVTLAALMAAGALLLYRASRAFEEEMRLPNADWEPYGEWENAVTREWSLVLGHQEGGT